MITNQFFDTSGRNKEMENNKALEKKTLSYRWIVWGIMVLAYMVVFFHRLAAGVVRDELVEAFSLSAASFGSLASMYFYAYMVMQIPVGILADSLGARKTVSTGMLLAGTGSILFGFAPSSGFIFLGRFLVGIGVSTVFVSILKIQSQWFREREFGTMSGLTAFLGNLGGVLAQTPLAIMVVMFTWRTTFAAIGAFSIVLALLCYLLIRNTPGEMGFPAINEAQKLRESAQMEKPDLLGALKEVISKWQVWPAFVFFGFFSGAYLAFAGAWGVSYLTEVYGMEKGSASAIVSFAIYGAMAGSFFTGWISDRLGLRKLPLLILGCLFTLGWGILVFYNGGMPPEGILQPLFFFMGFTGSCFVLSWAIAKEINPPRYTGISISVVNTGGFLGTAIVTTLMGVIIDRASDLAPLVQFHRAFLLCFAGCIIGIFCAMLLPETRCRNIYTKAD